jgi:Xaa-Pro aminopeptidase
LIDHVVGGIELGVTFDALYHRGAGWLRDNGFAGSGDSGHSFAEIFPSFGHSMGVVVEPPYLVEGEMTVVEPNVAIAVEGVVGHPGVGAAGFERNVIVTAAGIEILDAGSPTQWWD